MLISTKLTSVDYGLLYYKKSQTSDKPTVCTSEHFSTFDWAIFNKMLLSTNFLNFGVIFVDRLSKNTAYQHVAATRYLHKRVA